MTARAVWCSTGLSYSLNMLCAATTPPTDRRGYLTLEPGSRVRLTSRARHPAGRQWSVQNFVTNQLSISARLRSISRGSDADRRDGNRPTRRSSAQVGRFDSLPRGDAIAYGDRFFLEPPATSFLCSYLPTWLLAVSIHRRRVETRPALNRAIELALDWRRPVGQRSASGR